MDGVDDDGSDGGRGGGGGGDSGDPAAIFARLRPLGSTIRYTTPTGDVVSGRVGEDGGDGDGGEGDGGGGGGGSNPLLPLPPWASPIFMFIFIPPHSNEMDRAGLHTVADLESVVSSTLT